MCQDPVRKGGKNFKFISKNSLGPTFPWSFCVILWAVIEILDFILSTDGGRKSKGITRWTLHPQDKEWTAGETGVAPGDERLVIASALGR